MQLCKAFLWLPHRTRALDTIAALCYTASMDKTDKALVSVIIPAYNRAHLIERAIKSVLCQKGGAEGQWRAQCIVVDDCSIDDTQKVVNGIKTDEGQVIYERLAENRGAPAARNKGIDIAMGNAADRASSEYIAFLDSDDEWKEDYIERQLQFLQKTGADVVLCRMECLSEQGEHLHLFPNDSVAEGKLTYTDLLRYNAASTQAMFGKAECFCKVLFDEDMPRMQDWDEILRLSQCCKVYYQNTVLVSTYLQKDSITRHPERGAAACERIFKKHEKAILSDRRAGVSFYRKWASCVRQAGGNGAQLYLAAAKCGGGLKDWARWAMCAMTNGGK